MNTGSDRTSPNQAAFTRTRSTTCVREIWAAAPASVGNLICGLDALGLAVDGPRDRVAARLGGRTDGGRGTAPEVLVSHVRGDGATLPLDPRKNTASLAAAALLEIKGATGSRSKALELEIHKEVPISRGLGSSAACAVAAAVAVDELLELESSTGELLEAAIRAEESNCGARHPDNVAPALFGGCTLVCGDRAIEIPVPPGLSVAVCSPSHGWATRDSRGVLPDRIPLSTAVRQWSCLGATVSAFHTGDLELLRETLVDYVAEPVRAPLVPGFERTKRAALEAGALAASLSGGGPSLVAVCSSLEEAERVGAAMGAAYSEATLQECGVLASEVSRQGAAVFDSDARPSAESAVNAAQATRRERAAG